MKATKDQKRSVVIEQQIWETKCTVFVRFGTDEKKEKANKRQNKIYFMIKVDD